MKYSLIAKEYLAELDRKYPSVQHTMITWGDPETMEALFARFGGDRNALRQKTGCVGHHYRFKYVMDRLDRESKKPGALFEKYFLHYKGVINRPTRCFKLKHGEDETK